MSGANRGIGFEICRQLAAQGIHVVMGARDEAKGRQACAELRSSGLDVEFHRLDVDDDRSVAAIAAFLGREHGGADILVNNAGVMLDSKGGRLLTTSLATFEATLLTNFYGPLRLCQALVPPMLKQNYGRIVNLSSGLGQLAEMAGGTPAYRVSKTALNALTRILAAELHGGNILVNSLCPGWVKTDMGGPGATRSVAEGADTAAWLATLPDGGPSGGFFRDRKPIPW